MNICVSSPKKGNLKLLSALLVSSIFMAGWETSSAEKHFPCQAAESKCPVFGWKELTSIRTKKDMKSIPAIETSISTTIESSALQVDSYTVSEKERTASFTLKDRFGKEASYTAPLLRFVKIRLSKGRKDSRPIVALDVCLGNSWIPVEASLKRKSKIGHPLRLGRDDISGRVLVNPSLSLTSKPGCSLEKKK